MTQGKIERWHQTNRILLENYFLPGDLETQIADVVEDYNHVSARGRRQLTRLRRGASSRAGGH